MGKVKHNKGSTPLAYCNVIAQIAQIRNKRVEI